MGRLSPPGCPGFARTVPVVRHVGAASRASQTSRPFPSCQALGRIQPLEASLGSGWLRKPGAGRAGMLPSLLRRALAACRGVEGSRSSSVSRWHRAFPVPRTSRELRNRKLPRCRAPPRRSGSGACRGRLRCLRSARSAVFPPGSDVPGAPWVSEAEPGSHPGRGCVCSLGCLVLGDRPAGSFWQRGSRAAGPLLAPALRLLRPFPGSGLGPGSLPFPPLSL